MGCSEMTQKFITSSPEETAELARRMAEELTGGEVIAFTGGMGVGKTAFTRGLAIGLGAGDVASSPTFALINEYAGRLTLEHFDMYRIESWDDLYSTGFFDYLDQDAVLAIEWSENIQGLDVLPKGTIWITISRTGESSRSIEIEGGERFENLGD